MGNVFIGYENGMMVRLELRTILLSNYIVSGATYTSVHSVYIPHIGRKERHGQEARGIIQANANYKPMVYYRLDHPRLSSWTFRS